MASKLGDNLIFVIDSWMRIKSWSYLSQNFVPSFSTMMYAGDHVVNYLWLISILCTFLFDLANSWEVRVMSSFPSFSLLIALSTFYNLLLKIFAMISLFFLLPIFLDWLTNCLTVIFLFMNNCCYPSFGFGSVPGVADLLGDVHLKETYSGIYAYAELYKLTDIYPLIIFPAIFWSPSPCDSHNRKKYKNILDLLI